MRNGKDLSFGSQMRIDQHGVVMIIDNLFARIKEENRTKSKFFIAIKKRIDGKIVTVLQLKQISADQQATINKMLPELVYQLVKDSKPTSIFTRYGFH